MDPNSIVQLGIALAATAAAIAGFNALVGKGPRGSVWMIAACLFTWASVLPIVWRDPDSLTLTPGLELVVSVLRLCGVIGFVIGILDLFQQRTGEERHGLVSWALRQPLLWGIVICADFFALLYHGTIDSPLLWRYTAGHPVEVIEAAFFFIGMAILVIRLLDVLGQQKRNREVTLGPIPIGGQRIDACDAFLAKLASLPDGFQQTYLVRRLHDAIQFVRRKGAADALDQHLHHLEEMDAIQMHSAYATLRIIVWAIPILGFLGTVIGITVAIASLSPDALEQSMSEVTQGLGVAFDTTAEALALTMILMFTKALVERVENRLLADVDATVSRELVGRFQISVVESDPNVAVIRRMSDQVLTAVEAMASRQAEVWRSSIDQTNQQWAETSAATGRLIRDSLSDSMRENLERQAKVLDDGVSKHAEQLRMSAAQFVTALDDCTRKHADHLGVSAVQHGETLERNAQETVGRLREGLERLAELLVEALHKHGEVLTAGECELAESNRQHLSEVEVAMSRATAAAADRQENLVRQSEHLLKEMQIALVEAVGATVGQQEQLVRQGDILLKVVDATGQIKRLEEALNQNLETVSQAHNFEEMALSLSAAIQLLSARLGPRSALAADLHRSGDESVHKAA